MNNAKLRIAIPVEAKDFPKYKNYIDALTYLGADAVQTGPEDDPRQFDGLVMPGGADVAPERYNMPVNGAKGMDEALDEWQFAVLDRFVKAHKPVLGICRGHQAVNVYFGGTLIQHLPTSGRHSREDSPVEKVHGVTAEADSWVAEVYGKRFIANSSHHEAVDIPGKNIKIDARCTEDGTVEAIHHETLPVWSVQWHPERMCLEFADNERADGELILKWFLNQCK